MAKQLLFIFLLSSLTMFAQNIVLSGLNHGFEDIVQRIIMSSQMMISISLLIGLSYTIINLPIIMYLAISSLMIPSIKQNGNFHPMQQFSLMII